jgi:hypothetical protein
MAEAGAPEKAVHDRAASSIHVDGANLGAASRGALDPRAVAPSAAA